MSDIPGLRLFRLPVVNVEALALTALAVVQAGCSRRPAIREPPKSTVELAEPQLAAPARKQAAGRQAASGASSRPGHGGPGDYRSQPKPKWVFWFRAGDPGQGDGRRRQGRTGESELPFLPGSRLAGVARGGARRPGRVGHPGDTRRRSGRRTDRGPGGLRCHGKLRPCGGAVRTRIPRRAGGSRAARSPNGRLYSFQLAALSPGLPNFVLWSCPGSCWRRRPCNRP